MRLTADQIDAIEDLDTEQVSALKAVFAVVCNYFDAQVLRCSLGESGDETQERKLRAAKYRQEGVLKAETLFLKEIQDIRKASLDRLAALNAGPKKG